LHDITAHSFELQKTGDQYTVWIDPGAAIGGLPDGRQIGQDIRQDSFADPIDAAPGAYSFTAADIADDDDRQRRRRTKAKAVADIRHLSVVFRVLGDYLDRQAAADFVIFWSQHSVEIRYAGRAQVFTAQNLYDLGMIMYLKSSARGRKKDPPPAPPNEPPLTPHPSPKRNPPSAAQR
jgi:hypothetical protein